MSKDSIRHVSSAPTAPSKKLPAARFDIADLYQGPFTPEQAQAAPAELDEKLRQAYFWVINNAIISPHYDVEFNHEPPVVLAIGDRKSLLELPTAQSYSSFVLMPLLTLALQRKCLFIGGPGRGKTASALLMGVLAGYTPHDVKRAMQHGHPQMTVADLLGNPLPADLLKAENLGEIRVSWRRWLGMRVKIVDEYNRIPTRTQSALLTLMGDGYAELMDQIYESPPSAWYLTANDDAGGGTYQVIDALKDRIDVIVQALPFNPRFLPMLLARIEDNIKPEQWLPKSLVFNEAELEQMRESIRGIHFPPPVLRRIEYFASQFELCEAAAEQLEYKGKDTARLAGTDWAWLTAQDTGRDRTKDLGCQTRNGVSVRNLMTLLEYSKALAFFRGNTEVALDDVRQVLPFVLYDKLKPDLDAPIFQKPNYAGLRSDRISWLRMLFDQACAEFEQSNLDRDDAVGALLAQIHLGLDGLSANEVQKRLTQIERTITNLAASKKLYGSIHDDLLALKYLHQRYRNYLNWLRA